MTVKKAKDLLVKYGRKGFEIFYYDGWYPKILETQDVSKVFVLNPKIREKVFKTLENR